VMGNGAHRCETRVHPPLDMCLAGDAEPLCCTADAQCTERPHGHCIPYRYSPSCSPSSQAFHIPPPPPGNRCVYDACSSDVECQAEPNGFCTGSFPRSCVYGPCRANSDCTRRAGGQCVLATFCEWSVYQVAFCRYADDPCQSNTDCKADALGWLVCVPSDDRQGTVCKNIGPPPP
jgi:hypothetical protein